MNSEELWNMLKNMKTSEIQTLISMSIRYLEKERYVDFKDQLKDIKKVHKMLGV